MAQLEIRLLGGFTLHAEGDPVVRLPRQQALLAWLLLQPGQPQSRSRIASHFWPDASDPQGRSNLRKLLHDLRSAWPYGDTWIATDRDAIAWRTDRPYRLDVDQFLNLALPGGDAETIRAAVSAYGGDLLPDCYDDWILPFRVDLQRRFVGMLEEGMVLAETARDYHRGVAYGVRLLQEETLREDAYGSLMRLHAFGGGSSRRFARLPRVCFRDRAGTGCQSWAGDRRDVPITLGPNQGASNPKHRPRQPRRAEFIGRASEWLTLQTVWRSVLDGEPSIVVISGDSGVGKTRLAEEMQDWQRGKDSPCAAPRVMRVKKRCLSPGSRNCWLTVLSPRFPLCTCASWCGSYHGCGKKHPQMGEPGPMQEGWQRRLLLESISSALLAIQPVLLVVDDIQWCDPDSLMALEHLLRTDPASRCLLLATARALAGQNPSALFRDAKLQTIVTEIHLAPLDWDDTMRLAETQDPTISPVTSAQAAIDALYRETEGNPLFVVELVRAGWKPGTESAPPLPSSLSPKAWSGFKPHAGSWIGRTQRIRTRPHWPESWGSSAKHSCGLPGIGRRRSLPGDSSAWLTKPVTGLRLRRPQPIWERCTPGERSMTVEITKDKGVGIQVLGGSEGTTIGGTVAGAANVISNNLAYGIEVETGGSGAAPRGLVIEGNKIGVALNGTTALGNGGAGVFLQEGNVTVGGATPGAGNIIANNNFGILEATGVNDVAILSNSIYQNDQGGIIAVDQVSAPHILKTSLHSGKLSVDVQVQEKVGVVDRIQAFSNPACDAVDKNEGRIYLGEATFTGGSTGKIDKTVVVTDSGSGTGIAATLTEGSTTSEFSVCNHL